jgi:hypothetical protein
MNKFVIVFLLALITLTIAPRISALEFQRVVNPKLNLILPSSTPVPTKPIFKLPNKDFIPIVTLAISPSGTPAPTPTESVAPTITGSPIGSTGTDINTEIKESGPTGLNEAEEPKTTNPPPTQTQSIDKNLVIFVLTGLVIILLVATQWEKIKTWLHRKTA